MNGGQCSYSPYTTPQSFGKATHRATRKLPNSPRKKKAVIQGLAERVGLQIEHKMIKYCNKSEQGNNQFAETVKCVEEFYTRSDIAYTMPGTKDEVTLWIDGKKVKKRKYYLTMFLRKAYTILIETHPESKVGFSKFCSLRPKNVFLLHETPADQCKCRVHENFISWLKGLHIPYDTSSYHHALGVCTLRYSTKF